MHHQEPEISKGDFKRVEKLKINSNFGKAIHAFYKSMSSQEQNENLVFKYYELQLGKKDSTADASRPFETIKPFVIDENRIKLEKIQDYDTEKQKGIQELQEQINLQIETLAPLQDEDYQKLNKEALTGSQWKYNDTTLLPIKKSMENFKGVKKINTEIDGFEQWLKTHPEHQVSPAELKEFREAVIAGYAYNTGAKHHNAQMATTEVNELNKQDVLLQKASRYFNSNTDEGYVKDTKDTVLKGDKQPWSKFSVENARERLHNPLPPIPNESKISVNNRLKVICEEVTKKPGYALLDENDQQAVLKQYLIDIKVPPNNKKKSSPFIAELIEERLRPTRIKEVDKLIQESVSTFQTSVVSQNFANEQEAYRKVGEFHNKILQDKNFQNLPSDWRLHKMESYYKQLERATNNSTNPVINRVIKQQKDALTLFDVEKRINNLIDHYQNKNPKIAGKLRETLEKIHSTQGYMSSVAKGKDGLLADVKNIHKSTSFLPFFRPKTLGDSIKEIKNEVSPKQSRSFLKK